MATQYLDGKLFKTLVANGCQNLINDIDYINELNVFPVPDGDTGTNMRLTIEGGVKAITFDEEDSIALVAKKLARSMTMSARGNSGVILSQFFKGLAIGVENYTQIDVKELSEAFMSGVKQAYKVVQKPTEGTMLTVMREASEYCKAHLDELNSIEDYFSYFIKEAHASLNRTPDLLEVLKKAGVVDSGGAGYNRIIEGMIEALDGNILASFEEEEKPKQESIEHHHFNADSVLEFGYCTEFILQLQNSKVDVKNFDINEIVSYLKTIGNSIVAFKDEDIVKVHVHTFVPGEVISYCQKFGEYVTFKMENMSVQHSDLQEKQEAKEFKKYAVVAVSSGDGISELFKEMGCDVIVFGGQTMNPSSEDFIHAFDQLNAQNIICFPNNKNIIMAAKQAASVYRKANVVVMESKSISQCYSALSMLDFSSDDLTQIVDDFKMNMEHVCDACITYATRDCQIDDFIIKKDDFIGFVDHQLVCADKNRLNAIIKMLQKVEDMDDKQVITMISGKDVDEAEIQQVTDYILKTYPHIEVGHFAGKQDIYAYIFVIE